MGSFIGRGLPGSVCRRAEGAADTVPVKWKEKGGM